MAEKLYEYTGFQGVLHTWKDQAVERWRNWKENHPSVVTEYFNKNSVETKDVEDRQNALFGEFSHLYRRKTRKELVRISAAVMGIEFSYAAETAFVSPTLLRIGIEHKHMTLVWALSPLIGFFLTPILGSLSDRCALRMGRRRPFILCMSLGVLIGLLLVPNGESLGYAMGDYKPPNATKAISVTSQRGLAVSEADFKEKESNVSIRNLEINQTDGSVHSWGIFFTILGTVLLDFDADACQSPARAYLLDVTIVEDHARGLSTFTIMAGLGGFLGYALGGINWDVTSIGILLGGHIRAVFTLITVIFVICVSYTITSFKEIPLHLLEIQAASSFSLRESKDQGIPLSQRKSIERDRISSYGSVNSTGNETVEENLERSEEHNSPRGSIVPPPNASLTMYLKSIIYMPNSIRILCLTNLFSWMAHVCYSLYFTDFVGEAVFQGNPTALDETPSRQRYEEGIRFGCWGMSMYSLSCACYSFVIEDFIAKFGAKRVYVGGLLVYSSGMFLMALVKHKIGVIVFSWTAGVMYSTLFTMPYLLIAHYHAKGTFHLTVDGEHHVAHGQIRGLGTDVAIVSSMVFLAQFLLSICMGTIVTLAGTTTAVVCVASGLAFCGAVSATRVLYLDL